MSKSARGLVFVRVTIYLMLLSHKYWRCPGNVGRPCAASKPSTTHENFGGRLTLMPSYEYNTTVGLDRYQYSVSGIGRHQLYLYGIRIGNTEDDTSADTADA